MSQAYQMPGHPGWRKSTCSGGVESSCIAVYAGHQQIGDTKDGLTNSLVFTSSQALLALVQAVASNKIMRAA